MRLLLGYDEFVSGWVADRLPHVDDFGPCAAIGVVDEFDQMVAGVVFHGYQPRYRNIEVSTASTSSNWLTKSLISGIFAYPFAQLRVNRVTAVTPRRAASARQFLEDFGFKREGVARSGFGNDDAVLYSLLASEWASHRFNLARSDGHRQEYASAPGGSRSSRRRQRAKSSQHRLRDGAAKAEHGGDQRPNGLGHVVG